VNADGFLRLVSGQMGPVQTITLRRRNAPDVIVPAAVQIGGTSVVVGDVQQTADKIMCTDREIKAAWADDPKHGDQVIYSNGRTTMVQGRAEPVQFDADRVFVLRCLGG
jgi:hypothetical protein